MKVRDLLEKFNTDSINGIESLMIFNSTENTTLMACKIRYWENIKDNILDLEVDRLSLDVDCYKLVIYVL